MTSDVYDIALLTQKEFVYPSVVTPYIHNVLTEDALLIDALAAYNLSAVRVGWDDSSFNWSRVRCIVFRAIWDYYYRFEEFNRWLTSLPSSLGFIQDLSLIQWNMDKHYLKDLFETGVHIPPTVLIEKGSRRLLYDILVEHTWEKAVVKPAVGGAARHTYCFDKRDASAFQGVFQQLLETEAMLIQEYQHQIVTKGEVSFMLFGGSFSHAVLKKPKKNDFRVQDDHGGSVEPYTASVSEKIYAESVLRHLPKQPVYARVDAMWDNNNQLTLSELEIIEPELWFRFDAKSALAMAHAVKDALQSRLT